MKQDWQIGKTHGYRFGTVLVTACLIFPRRGSQWTFSLERRCISSPLASPQWMWSSNCWEDPNCSCGQELSLYPFREMVALDTGQLKRCRDLRRLLQLRQEQRWNSKWLPSPLLQRRSVTLAQKVWGNPTENPRCLSLMLNPRP